MTNSKGFPFTIYFNPKAMQYKVIPGNRALQQQKKQCYNAIKRPLKQYSIVITFKDLHRKLVPGK